jgi:hypothetical protein
VTACASAGGPITPPVTTPVVVETGSGSQTIMITRPAKGASELVPVSSGAAWRALTQALADLKLPVSKGDSLAGSVRSIGVVRRIGSEPISHFFDCPGAYENLAASGRVTVDVRSLISASGSDHALVATIIDASASPLTSGGTVSCSPSGNLYQLIVQGMYRRLGLTPP